MITRRTNETALYTMYFKTDSVATNIKVPLLQLFLNVLGFMKNLVALENHRFRPLKYSTLSPSQSIEG